MTFETARNNQATPDHPFVERRYNDRRYLDCGAAMAGICGQFYHGKEIQSASRRSISDQSTCAFQAHPTEGLRFAVEPPFMRR